MGAEPKLCICGHSREDHEPGRCWVRGCGCTRFSLTVPHNDLRPATIEAAPIVHQVAEGFDAQGRQCCIKCGKVIIDIGGRDPRVELVPSAFPAGAVTERRSPSATEWTTGWDTDAVQCWLVDVLSTGAQS